MAGLQGLGGGGGGWSSTGSGIGGGIGNLLYGMFGDYTNPYESTEPFFNQAQGYLGKIPGQLEPLFNPYMQNAQSMYGPLSTQLSNMMQNPAGTLNQIGKGYTASPGYEWAKNQALQAGQHAANAGGMAGTPMNQQNQMQMATQLANQDYYNWLQQATGMYGQGLQGAQNIYGGGLQAAGFYGNDLARALEAQAQTAQTQAQAAAAGTQAENQQEASTWGGLGSLIGGLLGFL